MSVSLLLISSFISFFTAEATWGSPPPELLAQWKKLKYQRRVPFAVEREVIDLEITNGSPNPLQGRVHKLNREKLSTVRKTDDMWFVKL